MSFHYQHQSPGVFLNDDLRIVQTAYSGVIAEVGQTFRPSHAEVARYVLRMYDRGIVDAQKLQQITSLHFHSRIQLSRLV
ncbi:hypothetical protein [uncultured Agrobacterium sp.]|uniref:hypothetical protein n=1 Tax=uncultured Agrobacterium sp. TaxID=157277 RepID=UPI00258CA41E|nr:hypothetical protein [uncultured Agrobacterium sp.]